MLLCYTAALLPCLSVRAENWNGRIAMLGFTGILITEFNTHKPTWQFWGERLSGH